jgi:hypothetical protein
MREERAHDRAFDETVLLQTLVLGLGLIMLGLAAMRTAGAAAAVELDEGIEWIGKA